LRAFGGDRGYLIKGRKFRDVVGELGPSQIRAGEMLGQEPFHVPQVLASQIRPAQILQ
jgi:hypothetical protein